MKSVFFLKCIISTFTIQARRKVFAIGAANWGEAGRKGGNYHHVR